MTGDITVIIPNWNGGARLERTLGSVARQSVTPQAVIVVDDGSTDDSPERAARAGARLIRLGCNSGFSRAVNTGVAAATTDWVFILNNDAILDEDCLALLLNAASQSDVAFAAPKILKLGQPDRLDGSFDLLARSGCAWRVGHDCPASILPSPNARVTFVPMTAVLINRGVFLEAGALEEGFESYLEDVEFCLRCALMGRSGLIVPAATARHEGSASLGAWSPRMVQLVARNQLLLVAKHWPKDWFLHYGWPVIVGQLLWGLLAFRRGAGLAWLKGKWAGVRMFTEFRHQWSQADAALLEGILRDSESRLREFQQSIGPEAFWSAYFRFVPEGRP